MDPPVAVPAATTRVCANHPTVASSSTCPRCGNFVCSDCIVDMLWGDEFCVACVERGAAQYPLAWERSDLGRLARLSSTTRAILFDTRQVFSHFPNGSVGRALGYATLVSLLVGLAEFGLSLVLTLIRGSLSPTIALLLGATVLVRVLLGLAGACVVGLLFQLGVVMAGGRADVATGLRAGAYVLGFQALAIPVQLVAAFLPLGMLYTLALAGAQLVFQTWALAMLATSRHKLDGGRAFFAGFTPALAAIVAGCLVGISAAFFRLARLV
jgi:hypothetical protein